MPDLNLVRFAWRPGFATSLQTTVAPSLLKVCRSVDGTEGYAWLTPDADIASALAAVIGGAPPGATPIPLDLLRDIAGAAADRDAPYRYIVETDVEDGYESDFNAWYDDEHLVGLAAVPGAVRAARYRANGERPRYHAYYDLEHPDVLGSPAWLAVRATPWSDRVRPRFVNTKRTMFRTCR